MWGVPAFSIDEGDLFAGHPEGWGKQQKAEYDAERYHRPADEYSADMDFRADARLAQFGFYRAAGPLGARGDLEAGGRV